MDSFSERLSREIRRQNLTPEALDAKAGLKKGIVQSLLRGKAPDDGDVVQVAKALDLRPSYLLFGVDDPTMLWSDTDMHRATSLNNIWLSASNRRLTPADAGRLFKGVMLAGGRLRRALVTRDMADGACRQMFPPPAVVHSGDCPEGHPCWCGANYLAARGRCPVPHDEI